MTNFEYLYVFNYSQPAIYEIPVTEDDDDLERILKAHDLNLDECSYMWTKEKLDIQTKDYIKTYTE